MKYTLSLAGILCEKESICGKLSIIPEAKGFRAEGNFADEKEFHKQISLLKAGITLWAYENQEERLLCACRGEGTAVFRAWEKIQWIFSCEQGLAAYWLARALTDRAESERYLAIYYAWKMLGNSEETEASAACRRIADDIRQNEEDLEERGITPKEVSYDEEMFRKLWNEVYNQILKK